MRLGLVQMLCSASKAENIAMARRVVGEAVAGGAQMVVLPECWNSPYEAAQFPAHAEVVDPQPEGDEAQAPSVAAMRGLAREHGVWLIGGSIPELEPETGRVFNTSLVFDDQGALVTRHRKMHLFDIDVPGKITFRESDTLSAGDQVTTFDSPFGKVGLAICYDVRFPLLAALMRREGCSLLVYPGAFNMTTGPAHWELLLRARALDTQCFVAGVAPARNEDASYTAWGHTTLVGPWGDVLAAAEHEAAVLLHDIDMGRAAEVREQIPVSVQEREDVYTLSSSG